MGRRVVVGTAGHIDHGKTALVKALTGVDTDRWEEEKRRGITIDLGFAPLDLPDGVVASVVDVPGHEGFVRNMLAGATGIDLALLIIAADEGFKPQTEEHLAIVELLGVRAGVPVLTKADLVDREWLDLVREEARERLSGRSPVSWSAPVATSAVSGEGLDELRGVIATTAAGLAERAEDDVFRLPIDRVFSVAGAGTVITGTTWSGSVAVGARVRLLPLDREARVRSIEVHARPAERAEPGRRTALALADVERDELTRGDVAVLGAGWCSSRVLDVEIQVLPAAARAIKPRMRVRVHLGTAEVLARVSGVGEIQPGGRGIARLALEAPLVARAGDRFVLRSYSPVTTIGGGTVLDPAPPKVTVARRRLGEVATPAGRLRRYAEEARLGGVARDALPIRLGIRPGEVDGAVEAAGAAVFDLGPLLVARAALTGEVARIGSMVSEYHAAHPLEPGMSLQAIRAAVPAPAPLIERLLDLAVRKNVMEITGGGSLARAPGWAPAFDARTGDAAAKLVARLRDARWQVPTLAELEREGGEGGGGATVKALAQMAVREGRLEQVDSERYMDPAALGEWRVALEQALRDLTRATPAQLRDHFGLTRKYLIPLLEWADRRGISRREGDARVLARPPA
ncbi:MAG: selenocysteine-specific translation elongation factor [Gemmatimonadales bacterium]